MQVDFAAQPKYCDFAIVEINIHEETSIMSTRKIGMQQSYHYLQAVNFLEITTLAASKIIPDFEAYNL
jgi:hypothetical protein